MCGHCKCEIVAVALSLGGGVYYHPECAPAAVRVMALRALGVQVGTG
jgi:hypothetical protein